MRKNLATQAANLSQAEQLVLLGALMQQSLSQNEHLQAAPAPRTIPLPKLRLPRTKKGWATLGLGAMLLLGAVSPDSAPATPQATLQTAAVSASATQAVPSCATEDQDGTCVWQGKVRTWDSRSDAEKATPTVTKTRTVRVTVTKHAAAPKVRVRTVPAAQATRLHCTETLTVEDGYAFCEG